VVVVVVVVVDNGVVREFCCNDGDDVEPIVSLCDVNWSPFEIYIARWGVAKNKKNEITVKLTGERYWWGCNGGDDTNDGIGKNDDCCCCCWIIPFVIVLIAKKKKKTVETNKNSSQSKFFVYEKVDLYYKKKL
jgi:hypothetical protein